MAFEYINLVKGGFVPAAASAMYTNPVGKKTGMRVFHIHNTSVDTPVTIELFYVPSGQVAGPEYSKYKETLDPDKTRIIEWGAPGLLIDSDNDTLQMTASVASKVTVTISGGAE